MYDVYRYMYVSVPGAAKSTLMEKDQTTVLPILTAVSVPGDAAPFRLGCVCVCVCVCVCLDISK
jgi:hypothetical protein